MIWVDLIVVLACIVWGARLGGIGLGTVAALGMGLFVFGFGRAPGELPRRGAAHRPLRRDRGGGAAGGRRSRPDGLGRGESAAPPPPADYSARAVHLLSVHVRLRHRACVLLAAAHHRRGLQEGEGTARTAALDLRHRVAGRRHRESDVRRHRRHGGALLEERQLWTHRRPADLHPFHADRRPRRRAFRQEDGRGTGPGSGLSGTARAAANSARRRISRRAPFRRERNGPCCCSLEP